MPALHKGASLNEVHVVQPVPAVLSEQGQDLGVGHFLLPEHVQDVADASQVEGFQSFLLSDKCGPCPPAE